MPRRRGDSLGCRPRPRGASRSGPVPTPSPGLAFDLGEHLERLQIRHGIALGVDRFVALLSGVSTIRDVMAFPKTQKAVDPLTGAPSAVSEAQLKELGIAILTISYLEINLRYV